MVNKLKLFLWLIIIIFIAYFASINTEPMVSVKLPPDYVTPKAPIGFVLVVSMVVGAFLVLMFTIIDWLSYKMDKRKLRKQIARLEVELERAKKEKEKLQEELRKLKEENFFLKEKQPEKSEVKENGSVRQGLHERKESEEKSETSISG
ncbi:MAG: LapA family protein [Aquificae bacterium]|nr:LapA family protein [Aquificota bacterium]